MLFGLSLPAIITAIVFAVLLIVSLVTNIRFKTFSPMTVVGLFVSILMFALIVYDTNCLTQGNCNVWSWVRTLLYIIGPTAIVVMMIISLAKNKAPEQNNSMGLGWYTHQEDDKFKIGYQF